MTDDTLAEQIAGHLRRDILRGTLPPGSRIKERDNAAELGVSRTPMREAIRILANEGLISLRPARSPVVAEPTFAEIADQVAVLLVLEKLAATLACDHATSDELAAIAAQHQEIARTYDKIDPLDLFEMDMRFHGAIVTASHNQALAETHLTFLERLWRARYLSASQSRSRERVATQHGAIVAALHARDKPAAAAAIDTHLGELASNIRAVMEAETAARSC